MINAEWSHSHKFEWVTTRGRALTEVGATACIDEINSTDWEAMAHGTVDEAADRLHRELNKIADKHIPWRIYKHRSTDDPWIDDKIRKKCEQRRAVYRDRGRGSVDWCELRGKTTDMIEKAKKRWYDRETEKLMTKGAHQLSYRALKSLSTAEIKNDWNIMKMRPGKTEAQVSEELVDYFAAITTNEDAPDDNTTPTTYDRELPQIEEEHVTERLIEMKKPKSYITIDMPAKVVNKTAAAVGPLLTYIINGIIGGQTWPRIWTKEEITVIPKTKDPESFDQLRGISCTSVYSKLAETYMLDVLKDEVGVGCEQFGGIKGVGTDHLMAELLTKTLEELDDNRGAVSILSLDYQKAFNRMRHDHCLRTLAEKGASNQSLKMAAGFLRGRSIRAKVGTVLSTARNTHGGAPQGTKSGNFFFTMSITDIEKSEEVTTSQDCCTDAQSTFGSTSQNDQAHHNDPVREESPFDPDTSMNVSRTDRRSHSRRSRLAGILNDTPDDPDTLFSQQELEEHQEFPQGWQKKPTWTYKYVDDVTVGGRNMIGHSVRHLTTSKEKRLIHAGDLQTTVENIATKSDLAGMKINPDKTQLICISPAINYEVSSYIKLGGTTIKSGDCLKILGFTMDSKCTAGAQVAVMKKKFAKRVWILRHLKRARIEKEKLIRVYCAFIRPCFDYLCATYHSMLTSTQSMALERMQSVALKTIFGWDVSYRQCLEKANINSLSERRHQMCLNFAKKTEANPRFAHWFPIRRQTDHDLRRTERLQVDFAKHERLRRSPIHFMRRLLNDQAHHQEPDHAELDGQ